MLLVSMLLGIGLKRCISIIALITTTPLSAATGTNINLQPGLPSFAQGSFWNSTATAGARDVPAEMADTFMFIFVVVRVVLFVLTIKHMNSNACLYQKGSQYHQMLRHAKKCSLHRAAEEMDMEGLEYGI